MDLRRRDLLAGAAALPLVGSAAGAVNPDAGRLVVVVCAGGWDTTYCLDPKYASGAFHTVEGLAMMALGLLMLSTFSWIIDQIPTAGRRGARD